MICPVMSRPATYNNGYGVDITDNYEVDCLEKRCQWWGKCKDPEGQELSDNTVAGVATETNNP